MKAITCSQCGALIKRVRIRDKFAECEYCYATIPILKEKVIEIDEKNSSQKKSNPEVIRQNYVSVELFQLTPQESESENNSFITNLMLILGFILVIGGLFFFISNNSSTSKKTSLGKIDDSPITATPTEIPSFEPTITQLPPQSISYKTYVKYNTLLRAEHIEQPVIEYEQFTTFDKEELKKTIFKEKRIKVQITINREGDVIEAKALNGHKVLKENSVKAAKKSLFATRRKPRKATLTYIYLLQE